MKRGRNNATSASQRRALIYKLLISCVLLFHLVAVVSPPFYAATQTPRGESPVAADAFGLLSPYINGLFLDHGYAFFAPDPGPSHLIKYRVEFDDGREPIELMFPDLDRHWPRLLYHRHFMLAEQLHADYASPIPPPRPVRQADEPAADWQRRLADWEVNHAIWRRRRDRYEAKWRSFEKHLLHRYGASRVTLVRVEHALAPPDSRGGDIDLRAPQSYLDLNEYPPAEPIAPTLPPAAPDVAVPLRPPNEAPPLEELP